FNTTPHIVTLILGITVAMEEKNSQQKEMDASSIDNVKASLMGRIINKRHAGFIAGHKTCCRLLLALGPGRRIFGAPGRKIDGGK
ncbi:PTS system mannose/fructose/sorbose family transporter subunit IID, partial [Salmonella enterica subsp. enterica serovar Anatum]|nr:PTS system mannose/fructose/sorbose family transporter subunit IID [Salmonella enterica subsp. enterica serovar Anatum]